MAMENVETAVVVVVVFAAADDDGQCEGVMRKGGMLYRPVDSVVVVVVDFDDDNY